MFPLDDRDVTDLPSHSKAADLDSDLATATDECESMHEIEARSQDLIAQTQNKSEIVRNRNLKKAGLLKNTFKNQVRRARVSEASLSLVGARWSIQ